MMKLVINTPKKTRAHRVLFDRDLPFKAKREEPRNQYRRQPKHRNKDFE